MDKYINAVQNDVIRAYKNHRRGKQNLSKKVRDALDALSRRTDIIIKPADKGGAIVMDKDVYIAAGIRQFYNTLFYQHLEADPTSEHHKYTAGTLYSLAKEWDISQRLRKALTAKHVPSPGRFCMLLKIHKKVNPGRPILSGIGTST